MRSCVKYSKSGSHGQLALYSDRVEVSWRYIAIAIAMILIYTAVGRLIRCVCTESGWKDGV